MKEQDDGDRAAVLSLRSAFEAAIAFGLTDEQAWLLVQRVSDVLPAETALDVAVERLTADLAAL